MQMKKWYIAPPSKETYNLKFYTIMEQILAVNIKKVQIWGKW